jgi:hypothetical protein
LKLRHRHTRLRNPALIVSHSRPASFHFHNSTNPRSHLSIHRVRAHRSKENDATHTVKPTETQPLTSPIVFDLTSPIVFELTSPIVFDLSLVVEREI